MQTLLDTLLSQYLDVHYLSSSDTNLTLFVRL